MGKATMAAGLLALAFLAGCADSNDGGDELNAANLDYAGEQSGQHQSTINCDRDGQLTGGGSLDEGQVTVRVKDGAGMTVYSKTFNDAVEVDSEGITGQPGEWTVEADRSGTANGARFDGTYDFALAC